MTTAPARREAILSVTEINRRVRTALAEEFPAVWVRGELTELRPPSASGHRYFSLKDDRSLLECAIFQREASRLRFELRNGLAVEAFGRISVFEPRGRYQLVIEAMRPAGLGERLLALEDLKRRLQAEGLFDAARKRPLPRYPSRIGIVTSPKGAAVRDLVTVLRARWPSIGIVFAPVRVQGEGAAIDIAEAIRRFDLYANVDLLIVGRGGGSIEDLWAFNEEPVVRAIAACRLPVISAVGHEVDTTLADLVADVRAATPSNAAEIAVRDRAEVRRGVDEKRRQLERAMRRSLQSRRQRLDHLLEKYAFRNPRELLQDWRRRVAECMARVAAQARRALDGWRRRFETARGAYGLREWPRRLSERHAGIDRTRERLVESLAATLAALGLKARAYDDRLRALSPRRVMERGYCLVRGPKGTLLRSADGLAVGDAIEVEFSRGGADARVEKLRRGEEER
jgi:exodeoxyribonuclease VII large subunit